MNTQTTEAALNGIISRVQRRLDALALSEHAVEKGSDAKVGTIRNWRRGAMPRIETIALIAPLLGTTPEWLAFEAGPETLDEIRQSGQSTLVPKLSWVSAGAFATTEGISENTEFDDYVSVSGLGNGEWYAFDIPIEFDSMDRISPPGSIIIVNRRDKRLVPNACYVITDGEGGATYKRFRPNPTRFEPVSTNAAHEPIFPDGGNMPGIFGRVKQSILNM